MQWQPDKRAVNFAKNFNSGLPSEKPELGVFRESNVGLDMQRRVNSRGRQDGRKCQGKERIAS